MSTKAEELKLDIEELNALLRQANRQRNKDILTLEIRRLQTDLARLTEQEKDALIKSSVATNTTQKCYEVKLNNYGWDQTNSIVKLYVTLQDVQLLPQESVICNFTDRSIDLRVCGLNNRNYQLGINNLCEEIVPDKSYAKVKTNMVVVFLEKKVSRSWSYVTGVEKRIKEAKTPSVPEIGEDSDPSASLMNLMKKMYQDGDDEMKKTIAKAWTESQEQKTASFSDYP